MAELMSNEEYIQRQGARCPNCRSLNIVGGSFATYEHGVYQTVICYTCDASWNDIYVLSCYDSFELEEGLATPLERFRETVMYLDMALTGMSEADVRHMHKNQHVSFDRWIEGDPVVLYLSDGGYSRLVLRWVDDTVGYRLHLASGARQEVVNKWEGLREQRHMVEDMINNYVADLERP